MDEIKKVAICKRPMLMIVRSLKLLEGGRVVFDIFLNFGKHLPSKQNCKNNYWGDILSFKMFGFSKIFV